MGPLSNAKSNTYKIIKFFAFLGENGMETISSTFAENVWLFHIEPAKDFNNTLQDFSADLR